MKAVIADWRTRCYCLRIECTNGTIVHLTDYPRDLTMNDASVYRSESGYQFTGYQSSASLSPGMMDLEGIATLAGIGKDAVASGIFDGARLYCFATSWKTPVVDEEEIGAAILGKTTLMDDKYRIEMMALIDVLNQSVGYSYQPGCTKVFGGQEFAGCKIALGPITVTGTLTSVTDASHFADSARTEADDYFGLGTIEFTSGANAGLRAQEIRVFSSGAIETFEPFYYAPAIGDVYTMIPGCRKRLQDCRDKWSNIANFGGFPDMPTSSSYGQIGS